MLLAWAAAGAWFIGSVWFAIAGFTPEQTHALATREDDSRFAAELLLVSASVASLVGTGLVLVKAHHAHGAGKGGLSVLAVVTVLVSWGVVHTVFALRYAHEFYGVPVGGIDFPGGEPPDYRDFAYVAFTVGMTYQISDTDVETRPIRRTILRHALLSYLFGAVILAVTVNVIASLLQQQ